MAVCEFHLNKRESIRRASSFMAILPEERTGPLPVLYLLHGYSDDHTMWTRRASVERHVENLPLIVIMPDAERSFYTNSYADSSTKFEDYITQDLIAFVDSMLPTIPTREGRAVAGLSMGGYGAMKLALKHPDLYCASVALSAAVLAASRDRTGLIEPFDREMAAIFGDDPRGGPDDILALLTEGDAATRPALRIDCGTEDFLYADNVKLHEQMIKLGIEHEYYERPGEHNWAYWDQAIVDALPFLKRNLNISEFVKKSS